MWGASSWGLRSLLPAPDPPSLVVFLSTKDQKALPVATRGASGSRARWPCHSSTSMHSANISEAPLFSGLHPVQARPSVLLRSPPGSRLLFQALRGRAHQPVGNTFGRAGLAGPGTGSRLQGEGRPLPAPPQGTQSSASCYSLRLRLLSEEVKCSRRGWRRTLDSEPRRREEDGLYRVRARVPLGWSRGN